MANSRENIFCPIKLFLSSSRLPLKRKTGVGAGGAGGASNVVSSLADAKPITAMPGQQVNERELMETMMRPAANEADRFEILDARDKLMRHRGLHRQGTLLKGKLLFLTGCNFAESLLLRLYELTVHDFVEKIVFLCCYFV